MNETLSQKAQKAEIVDVELETTEQKDVFATGKKEVENESTGKTVINQPATIESKISNKVQEYRTHGINPDELRVKSLEIYKNIDFANPETVVQFGSVASANAARFSEEMLNQVRSSNMETVGNKMTEVVMLAKSANINDLNSPLSRIPILGSLFKNIAIKKEKVMGRFDSLNTQIEKITTELDETQSNLSQRVNVMEDLFNYNKEEYYNLEAFILAGEIKSQEMGSEIDRLKLITDPNDSQGQQMILDKQNQYDRFNKRIHDLKLGQQICIQNAPQIRIIQSNNQALIEKIQNINELTLPLWKKQFTMAIAIMEQKKAVDFVNGVDDFTNEMMVKSAEQVKQNTIATAKANQRGIIDIETLQKVQQSLVSTFEEAVKIQKEGEQKRIAVEKSMEQMTREFGLKIQQASGSKQLGLNKNK